MSASNERGTRLLIGVVALLFSLVLAYFSASPELVCTRGSGPGVDCSASARVWWMVTVAADRVDHVQGAEMVASATGRSRTPPRLMLISGGTRHDLGYFSQLFTSDWQRIDQFARNPDAPELRLGKGLTFRTIAAHLACLFLLAVGLGMIRSAL